MSVVTGNLLLDRIFVEKFHIFNSDGTAFTSGMAH